MFTVHEFSPGESPRDTEKLLRAYLAIWNALENFRYLSFTLRPFTESQVRHWFDQATSASVHYLYAISDDGEILGIAAVRADPVSLCEIIGLGVSPDRQGRGIGRLLVSHSLDLSRSLGFDCVQAQVFADNSRMLRLLLSLEFIPVGIEHHRRADGADLVVLHRRTDQASEGLGYATEHANSPNRGSLISSADGQRSPLTEIPPESQYVGPHSTPIMAGGRTDTGRSLNKAWGVNAQHALYREDGKWYHHLQQFPGALFDSNGYVLFRTRDEYLNSPYLDHGQHLNIPSGISAIPGYVRVR